MAALVIKRVKGRRTRNFHWQLQFQNIGLTLHPLGGWAELASELVASSVHVPAMMTIRGTGNGRITVTTIPITSELPVVGPGTLNSFMEFTYCLGR